MDRPESLPWTNDPDADRLLASNDLALLIGMLLDQQFPMERAFFGPHLLAERLEIELEPEVVGEIDPGTLQEAFRGPPAIHRYPNAMADRTGDLCRHIVTRYGGETHQIWTTARTAAELLDRLLELPGFGEGKSRIFVGVLGKRLGIGPAGWEAVAADWPSIADVERWEDIADLRERKRAMKRTKKEAAVKEDARKAERGQ